MGRDIPKLVAQRMSGRVPVKERRGAWYVWECPCGDPRAQEHMFLRTPPTKEFCSYCQRAYLVFREGYNETADGNVGSPSVGRT